MAISMKSALIAITAPVALAALAGGSVAFAGSVLSGPEPEESYRTYQQSDVKDGSGCPHDGGGETGDSSTSLADQT